MTVMLAAVAAALFAIGTYLLLQRKLSRIIIGLGLLTHGANLLLITGRTPRQPADRRQRGRRRLRGSHCRRRSPSRRSSSPSASPSCCSRSRTAAGCSPPTTRCRTTSATARSLAPTSCTTRSPTRRRSSNGRRRRDLAGAPPDRPSAGRRGVVDPGRAVPGRPTGRRPLSILAVARRRRRRAARRGRPSRHARGGSRWMARPSRDQPRRRPVRRRPAGRRGDRSARRARSTRSASPAPSGTTSGFQSAYLVLAAGVAASFLTGDLFNLFVAFEMMLTASYVLLTLGGRREQVRAGMTYIVISLVASTLFVTALALLYSATGTVNMADLAQRLDELPSGVRTAFAVLLVVVFGIKAAVFPLFFWLPDSYPTAPIADHRRVRRSADQGGRVRHHPHAAAVVHRRDAAGNASPRRRRPPRWSSGCSAPSPRTTSAGSCRSSIVSQIGYMVMGLGFFTVAGVAAVVYSMIHHIIVKTAPVPHRRPRRPLGGSSRLSRIGGMVRTTPFLAAMFLVSALSLAGIPPLSGFISKFALDRRRHRREPATSRSWVSPRRQPAHPLRR